MQHASCGARKGKTGESEGASVARPPPNAPAMGETRTTRLRGLDDDIGSGLDELDEKKGEAAASLRAVLYDYAPMQPAALGGLQAGGRFQVQRGGRTRRSSTGNAQTHSLRHE